MDFLQLSILRAGGIPVELSDYRRDERRWTAPSALQPARSHRSERAKARVKPLGRSVGGLLLAMGQGLSALGLVLQQKAEKSAANAPIASCGATSATAH